MTKYKGIDYGRLDPTVNRNPETGIPQNSDVLQAWADSSEAWYGDPSCPDCGGELTETETDTYACEACETTVDSDHAYPMEPLGYYLEDSEYSAECGDSGDIFVTRSPYFTYAQFCSPCAPGACYLLNPLDTPDPDNKAYCFGPDWYEGKPPYPVYRVDTGELVATPESEGTHG